MKTPLLVLTHHEKLSLIHIRNGFTPLVRGLGGFDWWKKPRFGNLVLSSENQKKLFLNPNFIVWLDTVAENKNRFTETLITTFFFENNMGFLISKGVNYI
jgi:hypothetical protein